jgi:hypothetical protein
MVLNILQRNVSDDTPVVVSKQEMWKLFLEIRNIKSQKLTSKEIDILSQIITGNAPEKPTSNWKTYVKKIKEKGIDPNAIKDIDAKELTFQIKLVIDED